jgi:hypothetical protein
MPRCLKLKRQCKQIALHQAGRALYPEMVEMLLQRNNELALSKPCYRGGLLYLFIKKAVKLIETVCSNY